MRPGAEVDSPLTGGEVEGREHGVPVPDPREGEHGALVGVRHPHHRSTPRRVPQGRAGLLQCQELPVEHLLVGVERLDLVLVEQRQPSAVAQLLAGVDERDPLADHREHRGELEGVPEAFVLGAVGEVVVVVGDERHPHRVVGPGAVVPGVVDAQRVQVGPAGRDLVERLVPAPGVGGVEGLVVQVTGLPLGEHEHRLDRVEAHPHLAPELHRHEPGHVAAIAVHVTLADPELHGLGHVVRDTGLAVVEVDDVVPVPPGGGPEAPGPVTRVELRVRVHEHVVPRGVVAHPVKDHPHAEVVRGGDEVLQVLDGPEVRVHREVVLHGVRAAQRALAVDLPDRVHRHQPDDVGAEVLDPGQVRLRGTERALGRQLTLVELVEGGIAGPLGVGGRTRVGHRAPEGRKWSRGRRGGGGAAHDELGREQQVAGHGREPADLVDEVPAGGLGQRRDRLPNGGQGRVGELDQHAVVAAHDREVGGHPESCCARRPDHSQRHHVRSAHDRGHALIEEPLGGEHPALHVVRRALDPAREVRLGGSGSCSTCRGTERRHPADHGRVALLADRQTDPLMPHVVQVRHRQRHGGGVVGGQEGRRHVGQEAVDQDDRQPHLDQPDVALGCGVGDGVHPGDEDDPGDPVVEQHLARSRPRARRRGSGCTAPGCNRAGPGRSRSAWANLGKNGFSSSGTISPTSPAAARRSREGRS